MNLNYSRSIESDINTDSYLPASIEGKADEGFQLREITGTELVSLTYKLRYRVCSKEVLLSEDIQQRGLICDEHEGHARHWGVLSDDGILVASSRMCIHETEEGIPEAELYTQLQLPRPIASINRLVVDDYARKRNFARSLDTLRIEAARSARAACIVVAPTNGRRVRALENLGFSLTSAKCQSIYVHALWLPVMVMHL